MAEQGIGKSVIAAAAPLRMEVLGPWSSSSILSWHLRSQVEKFVFKEMTPYLEISILMSAPASTPCSFEARKASLLCKSDLRQNGASPRTTEEEKAR